jgi:hypothetical protein
MPQSKPYVHTDGRTLHLGRRKVSELTPETLRMNKYALVLPIPASAGVIWTKDVTQFGMMGNDLYSDCCEAAIGHAVQVVSLNDSMGEVTPPDALILDLYANSSGYVPGDPSTDNGSIISYVLNYVLKYSLAARRKHRRIHAASDLHAYAYVDPMDMGLVLQCISAFATLDIGLALPISCQRQVGSLWDVVGNPKTDENSMPGSWGGHSVVVPDFRVVDGQLQIGCITWGQVQWMSLSFWLGYVDEAYVLMFKAWIAAHPQLKALMAQVDADLALVG